MALAGILVLAVTHLRYDCGEPSTEVKAGPRQKDPGASDQKGNDCAGKELERGGHRELHHGDQYLRHFAPAPSESVGVSYQAGTGYLAAIGTWLMVSSDSPNGRAKTAA